MKLFKGSEKLKDELISEIKAHQKADEYIQSEWYNKNTGKGCHYGRIMQTEDYPREKFSDMYGIDLWYVFLTERLFQGLPKGEFENYPLESIEVFLKDGKLPKSINWNKIKSEFFYKLLDDQLKYCLDLKYHGDKKNTNYIKKCRDLFLVPFNEIDKKEADNIPSVSGLRYTCCIHNTAQNFAYYHYNTYNKKLYLNKIEEYYIWMRDLLFKCVKNNITF